MRILTLFLISFSVTPSCLLAAQSACMERTIPVSLSTIDGAPAPRLNASNLLGSYRSKSVVIKSVQIEEHRPRVILLVDTSGSMRFEGTGNAEFAEAVLSKLPPDMEVGLAFFSTKTVPMSPPTKDHAKLWFLLEALRRGDYGNEGLTALRSAVVDAVKMFGTPIFGDSVYLISDGGDNHSRAQNSDVAATLGRSGTRLFALMTISDEIGLRGRTTEELDAPSMLLALVRANGGTLVPKPGTTGVVSDLREKKGKEPQLAKEVSQQIDQLLNFYRVDVVLPEPMDKPRKWTLSIEGFDKTTSRKLELHYPTTFVPCR